MTGQDLTRYEPDAGARELGALFLLTRSSDHDSASCVLWTHWAGWELRLVLNGDRVSSKVCRTKADVTTTAERWKASLVGYGWR